MNSKQKTASDYLQALDDEQTTLLEHLNAQGHCPNSMTPVAMLHMAAFLSIHKLELSAEDFEACARAAYFRESRGKRREDAR